MPSAPQWKLREQAQAFRRRPIVERLFPHEIEHVRKDAEGRRRKVALRAAVSLTDLPGRVRLVTPANIGKGEVVQWRGATYRVASAAWHVGTGHLPDRSELVASMVA